LTDALAVLVENISDAHAWRNRRPRPTPLSVLDNFPSGAAAWDGPATEMAELLGLDLYGGDEDDD
jgi:hypothetical protein